MCLCVCVVNRDDTGGDVCVSVCVWLGALPNSALFFCFLIIKNTYLFGCVASCAAAYRNLVPQPGIEPTSPASGGGLITTRTTRESPVPYFRSPPFPKGIGLPNPGCVSG